jgi:AmpE protein
MNLLVLLIALGLRQFGLAQGMAVTVSGWTRSWVQGWEERGSREGWAGLLTVLLIVVLPVLLTALLAHLFSGLWHTLLLGVVSLLVMVMILLDRQLPGVLRRESEAWLAADEQARLLIVQADPAVLEKAAELEFQRARQALLAEQLRDLFAPIFWFLVLGPAAALAYHFLRLTAAREHAAGEKARALLYYAEWPVARVMALSFALAGDFLGAWQHWRAHVLDAGVAALEILDESAARAQHVDLGMRRDVMPGEVLGVALTMVSALLQRALIIWIVLLALHTLWP